MSASEISDTDTANVSETEPPRECTRSAETDGQEVSVSYVMASYASNQLPLQFVGQRAQLGEEMTMHRVVGHVLAVNSDV